MNKLASFFIEGVSINQRFDDLAGQKQGQPQNVADR